MKPTKAIILKIWYAALCSKIVDTAALKIYLTVNFTPKPISKLANKMFIEIFSIS
jgi:hypothetical protein